jgi:hypothetical protein
MWYFYLLCGFISFVWVIVAFKKNAPFILMLAAILGGFFSLGIIITGYLIVKSGMEKNGKN